MKKITTLMLSLLLLSAGAQANSRKAAHLGQRKAVALEKPVALPADNITSKGFRSNWQPVEGAEGYAVYVYTRQVAEAAGDYVLVDEDFNGITQGSFLEPLGGDEDLVNLDDYGYGDTPGWSAYAFPNFVPSMVAGKVYSPEIDLSHNDGKYQLVITVYANHGDEILVESHGEGEMVRKVFTVSLPGGGDGIYTETLDFDNGCQHLFFSIINQTAEVGQADYLDRVQVVQTLKKGDVVYTLAAVDDAIPAFYGEDDDIPVTCKTFTNVKYFAPDDDVFYYEVYASAYNFGYDANGHFTYEYVGSPYSDMIKVDLEKQTSGENNDDDTPGTGDDDQPQAGDGVLTLGEFDGDRDSQSAYDGANWYNSPMAFTYNNSGSQTIYLPGQLAALKGKLITAITFSCFAEGAYYTDDYQSTARLFLEEVDDVAFRVNPETGYKEWFDIDATGLVATESLNLDFAEASISEEPVHITFNLTTPWRYTGKTLLLSIANDSGQCLESGEYVRFYWVKGQKGDADRTVLFVNDYVDFLTNYEQNHRITLQDNYEYAQREAPAVRFSFADDTAVRGVADHVRPVESDRVFDLQGRAVSLQKGSRGGSRQLLVRNGRKFVR